MTHRYSDMNQHDALYKVACNDYPGGIDALAQELRIPKNTLRKKLAPDVTTHYASFEQVSVIVELFQHKQLPNAHLPLHAMLVRHGMEAFVVPRPEHVAVDDLSQTVCKVMSQVGAVAASVSQALLDGCITTTEADLIEREFSGALAALAEWRARIRLRGGRAGKD